VEPILISFFLPFHFFYSSSRVYSLIEVGLDGHLRKQRGHFLLMLYWYNKPLYQEKELNTRDRYQD
jgi:hypothetical protein